MSNLTRRAAIVAVPVAAAGVAGCGLLNSGGTISTTTVTAIINTVQALVAKACSAFGQVVPEATSILAMIEGYTGAIVVADEAAAIAAQIVGQACPVTPATASGKFALGDPQAPSSITIKDGKGNSHVINFIQFH